MRTLQSFKKSRSEENRERCARMGRASQRVQAERRMAGPFPDYPPMVGELLMIDRVTRPAFGSVEYVVRQGDRANRISVSVFGRVIGVRTWSDFFAARRRGVAG